jgi:hypothetical protein
MFGRNPKDFKRYYTRKGWAKHEWNKWWLTKDIKSHERDSYPAIYERVTQVPISRNKNLNPNIS